MVEDPFEGNLDALREAGEAVQGMAVALRTSRRKPGYVVLPADWLAALYRTPPVSRAAWVVAIRLIELFQMRKLRTVMLSNGILAHRGVGRWRKREALRELEGLGLIAVANHGKQASRITWLVNPLG
jgi:hypothetical protein